MYTVAFSVFNGLLLMHSEAERLLGRGSAEKRKRKKKKKTCHCCRHLQWAQSPAAVVFTDGKPMRNCVFVDLLPRGCEVWVGGQIHYSAF